MQVWFNIYKSISIIQHINTFKEISMRTEITFEEVQYHFMIKNPKGTRNRKNISQHNWGETKQTYGQVFTKWEPESISSRIWNETRVLTISVLFSVVWKGWDRTTREREGWLYRSVGCFPPGCLIPGTHKVAGHKSWLLKAIPPISNSHPPHVCWGMHTYTCMSICMSKHISTNKCGISM